MKHICCTRERKIMADTDDIYYDTSTYADSTEVVDDGSVNAIKRIRLIII